MNSRHIIKILDRTEWSRITEEDLSVIAEHIKFCQTCRHAFQAARVAAILLKEKSMAETPAPAPFFQAKVLNVWREKQIVQKPFAAFRRWWQASATLVLLMFLTVVGLMTVSLISPQTADVVADRQNSEIDLYSAETVILNQKTPRILTTEQVYELLDDK